jgi:hypothetical protein
MQKPAEGLKVQSTASRERVGEVIEENGGAGRRKIHLFHPLIFTARLALDQPGIVEEARTFDESVEMEALRPPFQRHRAIKVGRALIL